MRTTPLRRSLVAIGTAIACLIATATPTSATLYSAEITSGALVSSKTGVTEAFAFNPITTSCIDWDVQLDDSTGTTLRAIAFDGRHAYAYSNGQSYLTEIVQSNVGNSAGALGSTSTPHTVTNMRIGFASTIYNTTGCTPTGTPLCQVGFILSLSGTTTSTSVSSDFSLVGSSVGTVVGFPTCLAGPSQILGTSLVTTSPIMGHYTSSP